MSDYVFLILGLVVLVAAGDLLVRGSVSLAERLGIPPLIIGLTIVACGTSAPELFISVGAALEGAGGIAIGNVVGSNIANILLVLGLPALISPIQTREDGITRNTAFMIVVSIVFAALCFVGPLDRPQGVLLLAMLAYFLWNSVHHARRARRSEPAVGEHPHAWWLIALFIAGGLAGLPLGAHLTVDAARSIALSWGISEAAVGLTIVAVGTSLPEIAASLMAAARGSHGIALGNVVGSNLFNITAVMGVTASITPVDIPPPLLHLDIWVMLATALLLLPFVLGERRIGRVAGLAFLLGYAAYVIAVFSGHAV